ncbi:Uncharacterized protein APZ42_010024 [Daphnia magna]|uniref:Uncharacterized protein n=1 Tax=Daphnia magna TaxID=35525 RepID=A0A162BPU2_9CRUS|nr:Uncharacterized protein APZ42_010024 [Daphnia magna]
MGADEDIRWVITVPAIWRSAAKQLMREAAYEAGLGSDRLPHQVLISLKPEAASLFCRQLKRNQLKTEKPAELPLTPASLGKPRPLKPWNRSAQRESMYVDAVLDVCPGQRYNGRGLWRRCRNYWLQTDQMNTQGKTDIPAPQAPTPYPGYALHATLQAIKRHAVELMNQKEQVDHI